MRSTRNFVPSVSLEVVMSVRPSTVDFFWCLQRKQPSVSNFLTNMTMGLKIPFGRKSASRIHLSLKVGVVRQRPSLFETLT